MPAAATIRSLLFVPGDSERKIAKAMTGPADALILDLEDGVAPARKAAARALCREALDAARKDGPLLFVRINALGTADSLPDLAAVLGGAPFCIVMPKCQSAQNLLRMSDMLSALEAREGLVDGATRILPIATETGRSMLGFGSYAAAPLPRLWGLMWGAEDLAADLGARSNREEDGTYAQPFRLARSFCLYAAASTGSVAVDAVFTDFHDEVGLEQEARLAARAGFTAKAAIHPAQVEVINRAFSPSDTEVAQARRVLGAFASAGNSGVAALDDRMLDRPHLRAAERVLAAAGARAAEHRDQSPAPDRAMRVDRLG